MSTLVDQARKWADAIEEGVAHGVYIVGGPADCAAPVLRQLADRVQELEGKGEPLQEFTSPRGKILMRAWQEGWEACRDAEFVGKEAQNDAFNQSVTVNHCIAEDQLHETYASPPSSVQPGTKEHPHG
jgi:hypothetical protein